MSQVTRYKSPVFTRVGRARIPYSDDSSQAAFERSMREQIRQATQNFRDWVRHMEITSADVLLEALEPTFALSQEYVPEDTGALKESGYLEKRRIATRSIAEIGYARGGNPHYAAFVHENMEVWHEPPTSAKFLQRALQEDEANIQRRIVEGMKRASGV